MCSKLSCDHNLVKLTHLFSCLLKKCIEARQNGPFCKLYLSDISLSDLKVFRHLKLTFDTIHLNHWVTIICLFQIFQLDKCAVFSYKSGSYQFFYHCQNTASTDTDWIGIADNFQLHAIFLNFNIFNSSLCRTHT